MEKLTDAPSFETFRNLVGSTFTVEESDHEIELAAAVALLVGTFWIRRR